jgi:predicted negative regulator of RcsB-dependent stress response
VSERFMARQNILYLIIGALLVIVIGLGFYLWREEQQTGVEIEINREGIRIEGD